MYLTRETALTMNRINFLLVISILLSTTFLVAQDLCGDAEDLGTFTCGDQDAFFTGSSLTPDPEAEDCAIGFNAGWFTFQVDETVNYFEFAGIDEMELFEGSCGNLDLIEGCASYYRYNEPDPNATYYVLLLEDSGFEFFISEGRDHDICDQAEELGELSCDRSVNGAGNADDNTCRDPEAEACMEGLAGTWHTFTVADGIGSIRLSYLGDAELFKGSCNDLELVAECEANDEIEVEAGAQYFVLQNDISEFVIEPLPGAPFEDCSDAQLISGSTDSGDFGTECSSEAVSSCGGDHSIWFEYVVQNDATTLELVTEGFRGNDTWGALFSDCSTEIEATSGSCTDSPTFECLKAGSYLIEVISDIGESSVFIDIEEFSTGPDNNFCVNAEDLGTLECGDGEMTLRSNVTACPSDEAGSSCIRNDEGVWYKFELSDEVSTIEIEGDFELFEGDCSSLNSLGGCSIIVYELEEGEEYYLFLEADGGEVSLTLPEEPDNMFCSDRTEIRNLRYSNCCSPMLEVWFEIEGRNSDYILEFENLTLVNPQIELFLESCNVAPFFRGTPQELSDISLDRDDEIIVRVLSDVCGLFEFDIDDINTPDNSGCINGSLTTSRPEFPNIDPSGPFFPGETVEFSYLIEMDMIAGPSGSCALLQGVIPTIGPGWDLQSLQLSGQTLGPGWNWFSEGSVDYNLNSDSLSIQQNANNQNILTYGMGSIMSGELLPGGWWYTTDGDPSVCANDGDPDNMAGFPANCNAPLVLDLEFSMKVHNEEVCAEVDYLSVQLFAMTDYQTGCGSSDNCQVLRPTTGTYSVADFSCNEYEIAAKKYCNINEMNGVQDSLYLLLTSSGGVQMGQPPVLCNSGNVSNNIKWYEFIAGSSEVTIGFNDIDCSTVLGIPGIQVGVYEACFENSADCIVQDATCDGDISDFSITADVEIGNRYYLFVDGCTGSVCEYTFDIQNSIDFVMPEPQSILVYDCVQLFNPDECDSEGLSALMAPWEDLFLDIRHDGNSPNVGFNEFCSEYPDDFDATFIWSIDPPIEGYGSTVESNLKEDGQVFPFLLIPESADHQNYNVCLEFIEGPCCELFSDLCVEIVVRAPVIDLPQSVCVGEVLNLTVRNQKVGLEYFLIERNTNLVTELSTGSYELDFTNTAPGQVCFEFGYANTCFDTGEQICIDVIDNIQVNLQLPSEICEGETFQVEAIHSGSGPFTYNWNPSNANSSTIDIEASVPGSYEISLQVSSASGCESEVVTALYDVVAQIETPVLSCGTTTPNSVQVEWNLAPGSSEHDVFVNGVLASAQFDNQFLVTGLSPGETVTVCVISYGGSVSCESEMSCIECTAQQTGIIDNDGDGVIEGQDCDDNDPTVFPGAEEICDGKDNDCDGLFDEDIENAPQIFCTSTATSIEVSWDDVAPTYCIFVNGLLLGFQTDNFVTIDGLTPGEEVEIILEVKYGGVCPNSSFAIVCSTLDIVDNDGDGVSAADDCDDSDPTVFPGAVELCDGKDNDCDGDIDEDGGLAPTIDCAVSSTSIDFSWDDIAPSYCIFIDGIQVAFQVDNFYTVSGLQEAQSVQIQVDAKYNNICPDASSTVTCTTSAVTDNDGDGVSSEDDCDDNDPTVFPGATELCDNKDNDCNGVIDDFVGDAPVISCVTSTNSIEFSWNSVAPSYCVVINGGVQTTVTDLSYVVTGLVSGDIVEIQVIAKYGGQCPDVSSTLSCVTDSIVDNDGDGIPSNEDCDDNDPTVFPGAEEVCDGKDNDCNGIIDDGFQLSTYYIDSDDDGFGDPDSSVEDCEQPSGYVLDNTDCDDTDPNIFPGAVDILDNGIDEDCDGKDDSVGTYDIDGVELKLFPNPVSDQLNISSTDVLDLKLEIFDTQGQLIMYKEQAGQLIDLSSFPQGAYLIRLTSMNSGKYALETLIKE